MLLLGWKEGKTKGARVVGDFQPAHYRSKTKGVRYAGGGSPMLDWLLSPLLTSGSGFDGLEVLSFLRGRLHVGIAALGCPSSEARHAAAT